MERLAPRTAFALLVAVYVATLAPSVTLWDGGEFLSAIATLGVPHPPGTPLFVFAAAAWTRVVPWIELPVAVHLASALVTAAGIALLARAFLRRLGGLSVAAGLLVAGLAGSVWQSATEAEVYGWSLLLSGCMVVLGMRAGEAEEPATAERALAFTFGLAVSLHLSALVAGPAALWLATRGGVRWRAVQPLAGAWVLAVGLGQVSWPVMVIGAAILGSARASTTAAEVWHPLVLAGLVALGASFVLVMLVRAQHDPGVNQGNPASWSALVEVMARTQYDVPGLWPRRAPLWLQVGNLGQYWDWQYGFGLDDTPGASWRRTPIMLALLGCGLWGSARHFTRHRAGWIGLGLLVVSATLGVVLVLNLRAGPSFGWGVLPDEALREARERDYFFALGFGAFALWIGVGVSDLWRRLAGEGSLPVGLALVGAALVLSNWRAQDRGRLPDALVAPTLGEAVLTSVPPEAVLVTAGDNDSYAAWYTQRVRGLRRDVLVVTEPLLAARWYREEIRRRAGLLPDTLVERWSGARTTLLAIREAAQRRRRPFAVSAALPASQRRDLGEAWVFSGLAYVARSDGQGLSLDSARIRQVALGIPPELAQSQSPARDAAARYVHRLLGCPLAAQSTPDQGRSALLESTCNYR